MKEGIAYRKDSSPTKQLPSTEVKPDYRNAPKQSNDSKDLRRFLNRGNVEGMPKRSKASGGKYGSSRAASDDKKNALRSYSLHTVKQFFLRRFRSQTTQSSVEPNEGSEKKVLRATISGEFSALL